MDSSLARGLVFVDAPANRAGWLGRENFSNREGVLASAVQGDEHRECAVLADFADDAVASTLCVHLLPNRQFFEGVAKNYGLHRLALQGVLTSSMPLLRRASEKSFWFFLTGRGISPPALMFIPGLPFGAGPDLRCSGRVEARCVDAASFLPVVTFVPVTR